MEREPKLEAKPAEPGRETWTEEVPELALPERVSYLREHPGARWVLLAVVVLALVAAVAAWRYYAARESTDDAQIDGHITPVSARVSGTVLQVNFEDNAYVQAGTVLAQLDPKDYEVALARARAELADAEANARAAHTGVPVMSTSTASTLSSAQASLAAARKGADAARARLAEAQANYTKVAADLKRFQDLIARDEISQQQYDAAVAAEQAARATVEAAQAQVAMAQSRVAEAEAAVRAAQTAPQQVAMSEARAGAASAAVLKYQAAVEQAQLNLQYCTVRAPVTGVVSKRSVEPGQVVQAGQPLYALVNLDDLWVTANFKETQLRHMKPGQPASVSVDAFGRSYRGHVDSIGGATGARFSLLPPENATGNYVKVVQRIPVKIVLDPGQDPEHRLRPGMSVVPTVLVK
ncbi:MAG TPA: HlyD family secretion protein [Terriglobales bacterium]|nr:HlyD family secretion protein [Terriglobales bacterium]